MPFCNLCPRKNKFVPVDGTLDIGKVLLLAEAPGAQEDKSGRVFVGKTGQELDRHYLPLAGLRREFVIIVNSISCLPISAGGKLDPKRTKDIALLESCSACNVYPLIEELQPKVIVAMGSFACRAMDPDIDLEMQHGIPLRTAWGTVFPCYHPALGIHSPKSMLMLRLDWVRLGKYLKGKLSQPVDKYLNPDYSVIEQEDDLDEYLFGMEEHTLACDTETKKDSSPYCITLSVRQGTARLIRAENTETLKVLQRYLNRWKGKILFHNWLFDWRVTADMGLTFPLKRIIDTMLVAFHMGMIPQGLKALCYRELGLKMTDFEDVVRPHSTKLALDYFRAAQKIDWPKPEEELIREDNSWKLYKPQGLNTKLKRFFTDYSKNSDKDPFSMWNTWKDLSGSMMEDKLGPFPGICISHAPREDSDYYSCRDSDALLRLWGRLKQIRSRMRKGVVDGW